MNTAVIRNLEKMLASGKDGALLRFSLGNGYLKLGDPATAIRHFERSLEYDESYSAAWKQLGRGLTAAGRLEEALRAYRHGIEVAQGKGDMQAAKEMAVFARRIEKERPPVVADPDTGH